MATNPRKKMSFDLDEAPQAPVKVASPDKTTAKPATKVDKALPRKAVATRLPPDLYRQAKVRAALDDVTIQAVIESALRAYVAKAAAA